jgi:hypothetical protein
VEIYRLNSFLGERIIKDKSYSSGGCVKKKKSRTPSKVKQKKILNQQSFTGFLNVNKFLIFTCSFSIIGSISDFISLYTYFEENQLSKVNLSLVLSILICALSVSAIYFSYLEYKNLINLRYIKIISLCSVLAFFTFNRLEVPRQVYSNNLGVASIYNDEKNSQKIMIMGEVKEEFANQNLIHVKNIDDVFSNQDEDDFLTRKMESSDLDFLIWGEIVETLEKNKEISIYIKNKPLACFCLINLPKSFKIGSFKLSNLGYIKRDEFRKKLTETVKIVHLITLLEKNQISAKEAIAKAKSCTEDKDLVSKLIVFAAIKIENIDPEYKSISLSNSFAKTIDLAISIYPNSDTALYWKSIYLFIKSENSEAIKNLNRAIAITRLPQYYSLRARAKAKLNSCEEAKLDIILSQGHFKEIDFKDDVAIDEVREKCGQI